MFKIEGTTIYLTRGDTAEFNINIVDVDGNPYELQEGDLIEFTVKEDVYSSKALIYKTGTNIVIEPSDTSELRYGKLMKSPERAADKGESHRADLRAEKSLKKL